MKSEMCGIGQMALASGLTVSALRFYDTAGVLLPEWVDPHSGYRWYGAEQIGDARLIARLRRVSLPLPEIRRVLQSRRVDPATAEDILGRHLQRLEDGLADARRELFAARALLDPNKEFTVKNAVSESIAARLSGTQIATTAGDLVAALTAVRFAVSHDADLPMLRGVYVDVDVSGVRLVATDRYRMAVSALPAAVVSGPPIGSIVPVEFVDRVLAGVLADSSPAVLGFRGEDVSVRTASCDLDGRIVDLEFPAYRRLMETASSVGVVVDREDLWARISASASVAVLRPQDGTYFDAVALEVLSDELTVGLESGSESAIGVNREFLLQALAAGSGGELLLEMDGPIRPLAIRETDNPERFSILMPARLS